MIKLINTASKWQEQSCHLSYLKLENFVWLLAISVSVDLETLIEMLVRVLEVPAAVN